MSAFPCVSLDSVLFIDVKPTTKGSSPGPSVGSGTEGTNSKLQDTTNIDIPVEQQFSPQRVCFCAESRKRRKMLELPI